MFKHFRSEATRLRLQGFTYSDISNRLDKRISKSTLSDWFKNITYTLEQKAKIKDRQSFKIKLSQITGLKTIAKNRYIKLEGIYKNSTKYINGLDQYNQKLILSILHMTEGAKHSSTKDLRFTNSNPHIILLYLKLLFNSYKIDLSKMRVRIQARADQNVFKLNLFWKNLINIQNIRFYPTYIDKRTQGIKTNKLNYMGICSIFYFDTSIQIELEMISKLLINKTISKKQSVTAFIKGWQKP